MVQNEDACESDPGFRISCQVEQVTDSGFMVSVAESRFRVQGLADYSHGLSFVGWTAESRLRVKGLAGGFELRSQG